MLGLALLLAAAADAPPAPAAGTAASAPAAAQESPSRIEELENRIKALEEKQARREPKGQATGSVERPTNDRFRFGGYATVLYRSPDNPEEFPSFTGIRVVPQFSFDVSEGIEFAAEIEFEAGGFAEEFLDDSEVLVEYAEARFQVADSLVPKAGVLLVPFLRYNLNHDDPMWNLQDRPFTAIRVFKVALQQPGVGVEGAFPTEGGSSFNYNVALTNGMKDGVTNEGFEGARQGFRSDNNHGKTVWARAGAAPRLSFLDAADVGVSFASGAMNDGKTPAVDMMGWGLDAKLTRGRFDFIGEWTAFHYARPDSQPVATFPTQTEGAFLQVDTHLVRGLPKSKNGIVGPSSELILAVRYEWCDLNERVTGASPEDDCRALTIGLAFRFTPKTVLRVERKEERTSWNGPHSNDRSQWVVSLSTYF